MSTRAARALEAADVDYLLHSYEVDEALGDGYCAAVAAASGKKAEMAAIADAERVTGYVSGGISPIGQRRQLRTFLDISSYEYERIFVSAGKRGLQVELMVADLVEVTGAVVAHLG